MENRVIHIDRRTAKNIINKQFPFMLLAGLLGLLIPTIKNFEGLTLFIGLACIFLLSTIGFIWLYQFRIKTVSGTNIELNFTQNQIIETKRNQVVRSIDLQGASFKEIKLT